jgi:class 3 adenylate cyclase
LSSAAELLKRALYLTPLLAGTSWFGSGGFPRFWRLAALGLNLLNCILLSSVLALYGNPVALFPLLAAVACSGLLPEFLRPENRAPGSSVAENHPSCLPKEINENQNSELTAEPESVQGLANGSATRDISSVADASEPRVEVKEESPEKLTQLFATGEVSPTAVTDPVAAQPIAHLTPEDVTIVSETDFSKPKPVEKAEPGPAPLREECTVLHCELSNHAALVNALPPGEFAGIVNNVLSIFESMVEARGGVCDRLGSDGMRAFFREREGENHGGTPHAENALHCALALRTRLEGISQQCELHSGMELDLRLGINSGKMVVAPFGTPGRSRLGVAGEAAEWGVRLAGANLLYGSKILMGVRTRLLARESVETRSIDLLQRQLPPEPPEEVFELLALRGTLSSEALERLERYREGVALFRSRRWREAAAALRAARPSGQADDAIDLLLHRISEQEALAEYAVDGH